MPGPFTFPVAQAIPFEPNRNGSDILSEDVQAAIEEAKADALANDRYIILGFYGGNALTGRYLEFFPGFDSNEAPIFLPVASKLLTIVAASSSNSTGTISFYDLNVSSTNPVFSLSFNNEQRRAAVTTPSSPLYVFAPNAKVAIRVSSGTINKPHVYFFLSAAT